MKSHIFFLKSILMLFSINVYTSISDENIFEVLTFKEQIILNDSLNQFPFLRIASTNDKLYLFNRSKRLLNTNDTIFIYEFSDLLKLKYRIPYPRTDVFIDLAIQDSTLFILNQFSLLKMIIKVDKAELVDTKVLTENFKSIKVEDNKLILQSYCNRCQSPGFISKILNLDFTDEMEIKFSNSTAFQMVNYGPNHYMDYKNNKFIFSEIIDYKLNILNLVTNDTCVISRSGNIFNNSNEIRNMLKNFDNDLNKNSVAFVDSLHWLVGRINSAYFLDDSTLFVCYVKSSKDKSGILSFYDIWSYDSIKSDWILSKKDLRFYPENNNKKIENFDDIAGGIHLNYYVINGKILSINYFPFEVNSIIRNNITYDELNNQILEYYKSNKLSYKSIFIYDVNLD
ncbi:MAG: hypothetical protein RBT61_04145 [Candidatus Kapabacteria bacterium]|nr:hypothetical protein [Candidatus Kapabacteria bacterium]